ncbi:MAG: hypothetical protein V7647_1553 [Acidobacteriota bacterium]|jgi:hypothetical protein
MPTIPGRCVVGLATATLLLAAAASTQPAAGQQRGGSSSSGEAPLADLARAAIVTPPVLNMLERTAVRVLVEEIEKRTTIRLPVASQWPGDTVPAIAVGVLTGSANWAGAGLRGLPAVPTPGREGYRVAFNSSARQAPTVLVLGADSRGMLFGVGRLLRTLEMSPGMLRVPSTLAIVTTPQVALRGHQLGYRPKTNTYDAWDVPMWEQYIRDLAVFGTNAIELIPPRSDDDADSPHFTLRPMEMMVEMSRIANEYGLDVWIWYPAMDPDYGDPKQVEAAIAEWAAVFSRLPRIDAVFVPGGDPGHTQPKHLMAMLERQTASLHRYHPAAQMWMSPQGFTRAWMDEFYGILKTEPAWLTGIVFGPQVRDSLPVLRANVPARYRLRHYPDITHSLRSQYPVQDWDIAHALTSQREQINPRPEDEAVIFRSLRPFAPDFITYSEGSNDDVNKFVWSGLGWDPDAAVLETLREYSRYFIGPGYTDRFAQGLLGLERNWRGPLASNASVPATLEQFQSMERDAAPRDLRNWRFQQALYRAYYDAYVRSRLLQETGVEERAMGVLRSATTGTSTAALAEAIRILQAPRDKPSPEWRMRVYTLAEALFQSIRQQLSVARYRAIAVGRGATLDSVETPLNDAGWLLPRLAEAAALDSEAGRLAAIDRVVRWTDPGAGGFYDDLGNPARQPHLVPGLPFDQDPQRFQSPQTGFGYRPEWRVSWMTHAETFWDTPLEMRYTGLNGTARYRVRVVYAGDAFGPGTLIRLVANGRYEVHPPMPKPSPVAPVEFDLPIEATRGGELTLTFSGPSGLGGSGRANQVAEVWLMRAR